MTRIEPWAVRRMPASLLAAGLLLAMAPALPASAGQSTGHTGRWGVHTLLDGGSAEYPGQICQYQGTGDDAPGTLRRIAVRRPVIYAPDTTGGRDQRWVGWRFRIMRSLGDVTTEVYRSGIAKAVAYDDRPAALEPDGKNVTGVMNASYYTVVDFFWYTRTSMTDQTGKASHATKYSEYSGPVDGIVSGDCSGKITLKAGSTAPAATTPAGGGLHGGDVGLHALIDMPGEYPGATCVHSDSDELRKIRIRPPVVWAVNDTPGTDRQQVRWRYEIGGGDGGDPLERVITGPWITSDATDLRAARWTGRTVAVDGSDHPFWVVDIRIQWLGTAPKPYALHSPYHREGSGVRGYCTSA